MTHTPVNWNQQEDTYTQDFWNQNVMQFWLDKDFPVSDDLIVWHGLTSEQQQVYANVLGGLTGLDTKQTNTGMPVISLLTEGEQRKAVLNFMGAMEAVHAKSYSSIFTTLMPKEQIDEVFKWVETNHNLQRKIDIISNQYNKALDGHVRGTLTKVDRYLTYVASVLLESYLFYSGFYYPLYLTGQGKMTSSGEIIGLILRDESIHGLLVGIYAQETFSSMSAKEKGTALFLVNEMLEVLHEYEIAYTKDLYAPIGIADDVITFIEYNADKALANLGLPAKFNKTAVDVNPIVLNGINTATVNHDFFSVRGNGYVLTLNVEKIKDEHFQFEIVDEFA
jgi:ribonucleoside-diphosphate reductase beta chain